MRICASCLLVGVPFGNEIECKNVILILKIVYITIMVR